MTVFQEAKDKKDYSLKCPYMVQEFYSYTKDGNLDYRIQRHSDCIKEDCAAWQDGKCCRR